MSGGIPQFTHEENVQKFKKLQYELLEIKPGKDRKRNGWVLKAGDVIVVKNVTYELKSFWNYKLEVSVYTPHKDRMANVDLNFDGYGTFCLDYIVLDFSNDF